MDRKTFVRSLAGIAAVSPCSSAFATPEGGRCDSAACTSDAKAVRDFLSGFVRREEEALPRPALVKLMRERGRNCCRTLDFRQKLIADSAGSLDKLVELMGKLVGPANCTRQGDTVTLVYPVDHCVCTANPVRAPRPDDPYCECSMANNQLLFATVTGRPVEVELTDSPRRNGKPCRFILRVAQA